ncbi:Bacterial regulatory protein, tetR family [compost metagenome]
MDEPRKQQASSSGDAAGKKAPGKTATRGRKPKEMRTDVLVTPDAPLTRGARSRLATRSKLIDAAHSLMAEKGFEQCTIEEITRLADVGFGSFYNHFESKDDIAQAVFSQRAVEIGLITDDISGKESDKAVAISYIQRMFLTKAVHDPVWGRFIVRAQDSQRQMNETFVVRAACDIGMGVEQKRFTIPCVETAADITIAALISGMSRILAGGPSEQITAETIECLMRLYGIEPQEAGRLATLPLPEYVVARFSQPTA